MFAHYLSVALRQMRHSPFQAAVAISTLAVGLVCFIAAYTVVSFWDGADSYFRNAERTYVLTQGGLPMPRNPHAARYLETDFPELEAVARAMVLSDEYPVAAGDRAIRLNAVSVDPEFLSIFDLPFIAGDPVNALQRRSGVVLTRNAAERLFGAVNVLDRPLILDASQDLVVTGVIDAIPEPSHMGRSETAPLSFDILVSRRLFEGADEASNGLPENWVSGSPIITYLLLPADGSLTEERLTAGLTGFADRHAPSNIASDVDLAFGVVPVTELLSVVSAQQRIILLILGGLLLAVGCVNFTNLSASRAAFRAQEVGMRKAVGAKPYQITLQHLFEAGVMTVLALAIALVLLALVVPVIRSFTGIDIAAGVFTGVSVWAFLLALLLVVSVAASAYPVLVLSRVTPVTILRPNNLRLAPRKMFQILVGVQFAAASWFLIAVAVTFLQNREIERSYQYENDPLLIVENDVVGLSSEVLRSEWERLPQVTGTAVVEPFPWRLDTAIASLSASADAAAIPRDASIYWVSGDFFSTLDIDLLAGRSFDSNRAEDDSTWVETPPGVVPHMIIDRAMSKQLGFAAPEDAAGELVFLHSVNRQVPAGARPEAWRVIGVVENKPLNFFNPVGATGTVYRYFNFPVPQQIVRISGADVQAGIEGIDRVWRRLAPNVAIKRRFFDEYFDRAYRNLAIVNRGVSILAGLALFVSALGLLAVVTSVVSRRAHEIAVRKTVGAKTREVFRLLLRQFSKPVLIGSVAAWPFAFIAAAEYTSVLGNTLDPGLIPYIASLSLILLVEGLAVGRQAWFAARKLPADTLRSQ